VLSWRKQLADVSQIEVAMDKAKRPRLIVGLIAAGMALASCRGGSKAAGAGGASGAAGNLGAGGLGADGSGGVAAGGGVGSGGTGGSAGAGGVAGAGGTGGTATAGGGAGAGGGSAGAGGVAGAGGAGGTGGGAGSFGSGGAAAIDGGVGGAAIADIIPADRRVAWRPGLPQGIPSRTTICATVTQPPYSAAGNGTADDSAAIQKALDACPAGQVVLVPAGTYRIVTGLAIPSGVVLRGEGPGKTKIEGDGTTTKAILQAGSWDEANSPETTIASGFERGSSRLVLASTTGFALGDFVIIDQLNDGDLVRPDGLDMASAGESPCIWGSRADGTRLLGQMSEIKSMDAATKTIVIDPPLAMPLSASLGPGIQRVRKRITRDVGIEDLTVSDRAFREANDANIRFWGVAYSWIRNVESANVSGRHIMLTKVFRSEVRDSYVHHAHVYDPGANAYGISLENQSTETLIENNIVYYLNGGLMTNSTGPGNVLAYNYVDLMFGRNYPNATWLTGDLVANHCAHPYMNLWEGNMGSQIAGDNIHGSSSHSTFFRNDVDRQFAGFTLTGNLTDVVFAANNRFMNLVGNVLGRPGDDAIKGAVYEQTTGNCLDTVAVYKLGYPSNCAVGTVSDPKVATTMLRHGNYDFLTKAAKWDPAIADRELPPSLYLVAKPAYFGDLPWPPIGPDVAGYVNDIPAKVRFDKLPK